MEVEVRIDKSYVTPKIIVQTNEMTPEITEVVKRISDYSTQSLIGYRNDEIIILSLDDIYRIYAEDQKVMVQTQKETAQVRFRLYELEEKFAGTQLIRISNSEIVNFKKVKSLDLSISGTISLKFDTGERSFVSRRYVEKIKNIIGI